MKWGPSQHGSLGEVCEWREGVQLWIKPQQDATTTPISHSLVDVVFPNEILNFCKDHQKSLEKGGGERERERERGREEEKGRGGGEGEKERDIVSVCTNVRVTAYMIWTQSNILIVKYFNHCD